MDDIADLPLLDLSDRAVWQDLHTPLAEALDWWRQVMFSKNPPEHTRLRSLVSRVFTPRAVARLRPTMRARAEEIVVAAADVGALDAQGDLGHRLPLAVMSDLLDIPEAERATYASKPGDDLLSMLIEARDGSDRLSEDELVALVENLLFAGHDTTRGALAAMVVLLARHPDQYRAVATSPELVRTAVEEVLRYEPISFGTARFAAQEATIAAVAVPAGTAVGLCLVSAARDPRRYRDPHDFDVGRDEGLTPAFGAGIHYCVGAALARAELEEALAALVDNVTELTLTDEPQWVPFASIRHFRSPVTVALTR